jgi:FAD:protein FMN transferase
LNVTGKFASRLITALLLVLLVVGIKYLGSRNSAEESRKVTGFAFDTFTMGTVLTVKVRTADKDFAGKAAGRAREEVQRIEKIFNPRKPESEISRLSDSRGSGSQVPLSPDMSRVLTAALRVTRISNGAFDPALCDLSKLWGFSEEIKRTHVPDSAEIRAVMDSTTWSREIAVSPDGRFATLGRRAGRLDLGAIAKGYAVDKAVEVLRLFGVKNALVNLGGEIGVLGAGSDGTDWRVGIQHPRKRDCHLGAVKLTDGVYVATSGDYERYFIENGKRYYHILDPATGYPAARSVVSVTIIGPSGLECDALATAAFVLGPEAGIKLLEQDNYEGMIVYAPDGNTEDGVLDYKMTGGFDKYLKNPDLTGLPLP